VVVQCVQLVGGSVGYMGAVINLEKLNFAETLSQLPVTVNRLPIRLVVKFGMPSRPEGGREFLVQQEVVWQWLEYLKEHNPAYSDITIDKEVLGSLPDNGSVLGDIGVMEVAVDNKRAQQPAAAASGGAARLFNNSQGNDDNNDDDDDDDDNDTNEQLNVPDQ
jgi:hypothetical protein